MDLPELTSEWFPGERSPDVPAGFCSLRCLSFSSTCTTIGEDLSEHTHTHTIRVVIPGQQCLSTAKSLQNTAQVLFGEHTMSTRNSLTDECAGEQQTQHKLLKLLSSVVCLCSVS